MLQVAPVRALALVLSLAGCSAGLRTDAPAAAPTDLPNNLLRNPGFEERDAGWRIMPDRPYWGRFRLVERPVRSGRGAVHLPVHGEAGPGSRSTMIYGVLQELGERPFPDRLSGWYRVERWERPSPRTALYLQAVVIVMGDPRASQIVFPDSDERVNNYQVRYALAGIGHPPFRLTNARFEFVTREPPELGRWIHFDLPVRADFERHWGTLPDGYDFVRVLFEGRWDGKPPDEAAHADVYFDDLFFGYDRPPAGD